MRSKKIIFLLVFLSVIVSAQTQHTIMSYNVLNLVLTDTLERNPHFRTIFSNIQPDILVCQEMTSVTGVNGFLSRVLNKVSSGYAAGTFINGFDTDNAIYYKTDLFTFLSNTPIATGLRDINEFRLRYNSTGDTIIIYSLHLKAGDSGSDSLQRAAEVDILRNRTNSLPPNSNFIVVGDFNIYNSNESAFQKLLNQSQSGYFIDPLNLIGRWNNNAAFAPYHTQSTRTRNLGDGGATGGLDDRFDMILMSQGIMNPGGITYIPGSYIAYGNDGMHFNDSINKPPNNAVGQTIANALHYATDHLPVIARFSFDAPYTQLTLNVLIEGFYNGITNNPDSITVELRSSVYPYSLVDQQKVYLNNAGIGTGKFYNAANGTPYYIVIKHRNAVETWSATTQSFTNGVMSYDFTTAKNKAYGDNLKLINTKWCIYGGDVDQDGYVTGADLNTVYSSNINGLNGYVTSDLTGDSFVDASDISIVFINYVLGSESKKP
ncbi:MAG: hypothetical protein B6D44_00080 [Ignavibacteriales bacterium UTCHB2]|jgi:endonuclease/exonuclease/phosphatase family metal-dependent hydrolase|nr:MAG: hypothetical protein B6D44_00080 [Ignavibacteriales bacterium UTCHB2]HQI42431.1 hypothetical protein [Ignavibacteriaceae bacterium]